jgi:hypothetical protein
MKFTPCILHLKSLHGEEQVIVPPFTASTVKGLVAVSSH